MKKNSTGRPRGRPRKIPLVASDVVADDPPALVFPIPHSVPDQTIPAQVSDQPLPQPKRRGRPPKKRLLSSLPNTLPVKLSKPKGTPGRKRKVQSTIDSDMISRDTLIFDSASSTSGDDHNMPSITACDVIDDRTTEICHVDHLASDKSIHVAEKVTKQPNKIPKRRGRPPGKSKTANSMKNQNVDVPAQIQTVACAEKESFIQSVTIAKRKGRKRGPKKGWKKLLAAKLAGKNLPGKVAR